MNTRESVLWTQNPLILLKTAGIALLPALPAFADLQTWGGENTHWWDDLSWDGGQFEDNVPDGDIVHIKNPSGAAPSSSDDNSFLGGPGAAILTYPTIDQQPAFPNGITWKPGTMEKPLGVFGRENDPTEDYWFYRIASMEISNGGEFLNWATRERSFSFCNRMLGFVHPVTWGVPYSAESALSSQGVNIGVSDAGYAKTMGNWFINGQLQIGHSAPGRLLQTGGHIFVAEQMRVRLNSEFDQRGGSILANRGIQMDTTSVLESSGLLTARSFDPGLAAALSSGPDTILRLTNGSSNFEGKVVLSGDLTAHTHQMESTLDITMGSISEQTLSQGSLSFTDTSLESTNGSIVLLARSIGAGNSDFTAAGAINISPYYDGGEGVLNGCEFTSSSFTSSANTRITESEITASTVTAGGELSDTIIHTGSMTAGTLTTKDGSRVAATGGFSVGGTWNLEGAGTTATGVSAGIGGATWQRALNITGGARMTLSGWSNVATGGTLAVAGGGSRLDAPYLTMGGTQETPANVRVTGGGSVTLIGNLTTGNAYQTQSGITVSGTSRLDCAEARLNSLQDTGTSLDLYAGGTLRAPGGVFLNHGNFAENTATITMGAYFPLNDLFMDPGFIDAPFLEKSPGTGMATLRFRHRQQDALFTPELRGVDIVESTGPGRTVLRGRMTNTAVLRADAGTLEINHGGAPNTVLQGVQVRGGNLVVNGADLLVDPAGFSATSMSAGTLSVTGGGYLRTALVMSGTNGATPVATVSGLGSELLVQKPFMQVGDAGRARLTIADLGVVTCDPSTSTVLRAGGSATGDGTVEVEEWSELRANHISVGYQGHGNLYIHSGGKVLGHGGSPSAIVHVGDQAESTGFVSMDGEGVLKTNELRIGNFGTGTLEMLSGTVEVTGPTTAGYGDGGGGGSIEVYGSSVLRANGGLTIGRDGAASSLKLSDGGTAWVGADGTGMLRLGVEAPALLEISQIDGTAPGRLMAGSVVGRGASSRVIISHNSPDYTFGTPLSDVFLNIFGEGRTNMQLPVTLTGLEIYRGTLATRDQTRNTYADTTVGSNSQTRAWLEVEGNFLSDGVVHIKGGRPDTGIRLDNGARLHVGQGTLEVLMGRAADGSYAGHGGGAIIFGGVGYGQVVASAIRGVGPVNADPAQNSSVIFDHTDELHFSTPLAGSVSVFQRGSGYTVMNGTHTQTGGTVVTGGELIVNGTMSGTDTVVTGGILAGTGTIRRVVINSGGTIAPGDNRDTETPVATLLIPQNTTFGPGGRYLVDIGDWAGGTPGTHWDRLRVGTLLNSATAQEPFVIKISGPTANFQETVKTLAIVQRTGLGSVAHPNNFIVDDSDFPGTGTWSVRSTVSTLYLDYTPGTETPFQEWARQNGLPDGENGAGDDADKDGMNNLGEFALDRDPDGGGGAVKQDVRTMTAGGFPCVYLTIPVRSGAVFGGSPALVSGPAGGVTYRIEAGTDLAGWNLPVTEVTGGGQYSIHALMPPLSNANWTYRTFRTVPGADLEGQFIRCRVEAGNTFSPHH